MGPMTTDTRRRIFRFAVAADLVILAIGVGLLYPSNALILRAAFVVAVLLAAWKSGWSGGLIAAALSLLAMAGMFRPPLNAASLVAFAVAALVGTALVRGAMAWPRRGVVAPIPEVPAAAEPDNVVTFDRPALVPPSQPEPVEKQADDAEQTAAGERAARELAERLDAERKAMAESSARRLAEERAELQRKMDERYAEEQRMSAEMARRRQEEERQAFLQELETRVAAERQAAERESQRKLEEERAALQRELEAKAAAEREAQRLAAEAQQKLEQERAAMARELEERLAAEREVARQMAEAAGQRKLQEERAAIQAELEAAFVADRERMRKAAEEARQAEEARAAAQQLLDEKAAADRALLQRQIDELRTADPSAKPAKPVEELTEPVEKLAEPLAAMPPPVPVPSAPPPIVPTSRSSTPPPSGPAPWIAASRPAEPARESLLSKLTGLFRRVPEPPRANVNMKGKKGSLSDTASRKAAAAAPRKEGAPRTDIVSNSVVKKGPRGERPPRLLLLERRRGTADAVAPRLRQRGIEVEVVERWIDAVDEIFRFFPDVLFIDSEIADFERVYRSIADHHATLPIVLTGKSASGFVPPSGVRYAELVSRPYDTDQLARIAREAKNDPQKMNARVGVRGSASPRLTPPPPSRLPLAAPPPMPRGGMAAAGTAAPARRPAVQPAAAAPMAMAAGGDTGFLVGAAPMPQTAVPAPLTSKPRRGDGDGEAYEVACYTCRSDFDAMDADWCSCLTKERTLVCTNCLSCFCKAPPSYKEKFWVEAPPPLFERRAAGNRSESALTPNAVLNDVTRPLVLSVEDDEEIQRIVQRVCTNLGYGFIYATNGQDGLELARGYRPNLILSDAFMPKLDGREMCRLLKQEPAGVDCKMVVMTGLYTDTKYRSEALKRFHVDDYLAKPVAITELINLLQKHLDGVTGLPQQEDLHELHRRHRAERPFTDGDDPDDIALADLLQAEQHADGHAGEAEAELPPAPPPPESYEVCCFTCQKLFDATRAEWCSCVGRDQTLLCPHCLTCFCKAPAAYKERFWIDAPPSLFERKMLGSKRNISPRSNPSPAEVKRPLILLVEDDENVQLIVRTVVTTMGFGFIVGADGQEGLSLAREYGPDLILSDAFMPKLDGREMCRLLKEDPATNRVKAIIMTGLYTDRKYRNEALDYFRVDDYVAKPLAVDDLIKLFKKHLPQDVATM
jgi:DNA-binding response OmpR family regulator